MPKVVIKETVTIKREACESGDGISEELKADWDEAKRRRFAEYNLNLDNTLATRIPEFEMSEEFLHGPPSWDNATRLEDNAVTMFDDDLRHTTWFSSFLIHLCEVIRSTRKKAPEYISKYLGNVPKTCTFDLIATFLTYECGNTIVDTVPLLETFSQRYLNIWTDHDFGSFLAEEQDPFKVFDKVLDDVESFPEMAFFDSFLKFEVHETLVCHNCHTRTSLGDRKVSHIVLEPKEEYSNLDYVIEDNDLSHGTCSNCQGKCSKETLYQGRPNFLTYRFEERSNVYFEDTVEIQGYAYEPIIVMRQAKSIGAKVGDYFTTIKRFDQWYRVDSNRHPDEDEAVTNGIGMVMIVLKRVGQGLGQR